jgi:hypothetical protein
MYPCSWAIELHIRNSSVSNGVIDYSENSQTCTVLHINMVTITWFISEITILKVHLSTEWHKSMVL